MLRIKELLNSSTKLSFAELCILAILLITFSLLLVPNPKKASSGNYREQARDFLRKVGAGLSQYKDIYGKYPKVIDKMNTSDSDLHFSNASVLEKYLEITNTLNKQKPQYKTVIPQFVNKKRNRTIFFVIPNTSRSVWNNDNTIQKTSLKPSVVLLALEIEGIHNNLDILLDRLSIDLNDQSTLEDQLGFKYGAVALFDTGDTLFLNPTMKITEFADLICVTKAQR